tara:strand:- start:2119 stop:2409 length:291 start_codon:yes stop_codon:yes gene_type:complete
MSIVKSIRKLLLSKPYGYRFTSVFKDCEDTQTDFTDELQELSSMHCGTAFVVLIDELLEPKDRDQLELPFDEEPTPEESIDLSVNESFWDKFRPSK